MYVNDLFILISTFYISLIQELANTFCYYSIKINLSQNIVSSNLTSRDDKNFQDSFRPLK